MDYVDISTSAVRPDSDRENLKFEKDVYESGTAPFIYKYDVRDKAIVFTHEFNIKGEKKYAWVNHLCNPSGELDDLELDIFHKVMSEYAEAAKNNFKGYTTKK